MGLSSNTTGLNEILTTVRNLPPAGGPKPETTFDVTPTASAQTITPPDGFVFSGGTVQAIQTETKETTENGDVTPSSGKFLTKVTVNVPTGTARSSADLTVSGATVTVPAGLYAANASKSVATVSRANTSLSSSADTTNAKLTFTASNNQGTGYVTGSNKTATATVTLSASGQTVTASDGTNSVSKSVASGTAGTPTGTKGTVSNYAVTVTPKVTNSAGYISGGTITGTGVAVSASDLGLGTVTSLTKSGGTVSLAKNKYSTSNLSTTVTPSDLGLSTVSALTKSGGTVSIDANKYGTSKLTATVTAADVTSGTALITSTAATDVTNYASAQVSDANLVAENIAKDVNILGVIGTLNPKKAEIGTFAESNQAVSRTISHTLGQIPDFVLFISSDATSQKVFKTLYGGWSKKELGGQPTTFPGQVTLSLSAGAPTSNPTMTKQTAEITLTSGVTWGAPHSATDTQFTVGGNSNIGYLAGNYFWIAMIF